MINRSEIKQEAKVMLRQAGIHPLVMTGILLAITTVLNRIVLLLETGTLLPELDTLTMLTDPGAFMASAEVVAHSTASTFFFSTLVDLFLVVLTGGYTLYCMALRQGVKAPYATIFDGLAMAGKLIWCSILMGIKVFLWSMLFVIPGLVAIYRYRFAYYNLLTDDSLTVSQAIALSCRQTRGMKMDLFVLDLSFIGWSLLTGLTLGLLNIWLQPYMALSDLAYFEQAQIRLGHTPYGRETQWEEPWDDQSAY